MIESNPIPAPLDQAKKHRIKPKTPTWLIVVLSLMISYIFLYYIYSFINTPSTRSTPEILTRENFKSLIDMKTPDEVMRLVGPPDRTSGSNSENWIYRGKTYDPITGKTDYLIVVIFENGHVVNISF